MLGPEDWAFRQPSDPNTHFTQFTRSFLHENILNERPKLLYKYKCK